MPPDQGTNREQEPSERQARGGSSRPLNKRLRRQAWSFVEALVMAAMALTAALAFNHLRPNPLPLVRRAPFDIYTDCPEVSDHLPSVTAERLGPHPKGVVFVDGRRAWDYCRGHVPGAWFLPMYETEGPDPATVRRLKARRGHWIVVYGDVSLAGGKRLTSALMAEGLRGLHLLQGGLKAWKEKGFPLETCHIERLDPTKTKVSLDRYFLVDARSPEAFAKGHLPGAMNLPFDDVLPPEPKDLAKILAAKKPILVLDEGAAIQNGLRPGWAVAAQIKARGAEKVLVLARRREKNAAPRGANETRPPEFQKRQPVPNPPAEDEGSAPGQDRSSGRMP